MSPFRAIYAVKAPAIKEIKIGTHLEAASLLSFTFRIFIIIKYNNSAATTPPKTGEITQLAAILAINEKSLKEENKILIEDLRSDPNKNCFISGDIDEINQVFVNLLENAIKYGFDNTNVIVRIEQEKNKEIKVSVINNGEGIPDKYIDRLTERFFRVDKARSRKIGGTGLGLAIVKHILIKHRAQLSINSIPNQETNFSITFPVIN